MLPDVSIRCDIGFEEDLMRRLVEGTMDVGLMYTPQLSPGLRIEHLFDETLVLVTTDPNKPWPDIGYIYVDWGPALYAQHSSSYPNFERPAQVVNIGWMAIQLAISNGGSCFLPVRLAEPLIKARKLYRVPGSLQFRLPAYMAYPGESESSVLQQVVENLRTFASSEKR